MPNPPDDLLLRIAKSIASLRLGERKDEITDDLVQMYLSRRDRLGRRRAALRSIADAVSIAIFGVGDQSRSTRSGLTSMLLPTAFRHSLRFLSKSPGYAFLNVAGLAVGIAASVVLLEYVQFETSYDDVEDADRIVRVRNDYVRFGGLIYDSAGTFPGVGPTLEETLPQVRAVARLYNAGGEMNVTLRPTDSTAPLVESELLYANGSFASMFDVKSVAGDAGSALDKPDTIVLSEAASRRHFGAIDPIGATMLLQDDDKNSRQLTVGAVVENPPANTHIPFDVLVSYNTLFEGGDARSTFDTWWAGAAHIHTYLLLDRAESASVVRSILPELLDRNKPSLMETSEDGHRLRVHNFHVDPLRSIHGRSNLQNDIILNGNARSVTILLITAVLILGIAWINYVNISTARATDRAREVGVRKVLGSTRRQLIQRFLVETLLINLAAFGIAVLAVAACRPFTSALVSQELPSLWSYGRLRWIVPVAALFGALISGLAPALHLSGFEPARVLKGIRASSGRSHMQRRILVVFQFGVAVLLIISTMTIIRQVSFMQSRDLGFESARMLAIRIPTIAADSDQVRSDRIARFKQRVAEVPGVRAVTGSDIVPGQTILRGLAMARTGYRDRDNIKSIEGVQVDRQFFSSYGIEMVAGRGFEANRTDSLGVIFNETAIQRLGFDSPETAVGELVGFDGRDHPVIGVVADFHQESLHRARDPMYFILAPPESQDFVSVRLRPEGLQRSVERLDGIFSSTYPGYGFDSFFVDDRFDAQYRQDRVFETLFELFAGLAIVIACLGLFGFSTYVMRRRTREIGIRKINGATTVHILRLFGREFLVPVVAGFVFAVPIALWFLQSWLDSYAFRIDLTPDLFVISGVVVLVVASASILHTVVRAVRLRPVESLRVS